MRRDRLGATWLVAAACASAVAGCEAILQTGSLREREARPDASTAAEAGEDSTAGDGPSSSNGGSSGSSGDAPVSPGDGGHEAGCSTDAGGCNGAQPQKCANGTWVDEGTACGSPTPACLAGACVSCSPGSTQCSGSSLQTCAADGTWGAAVACTGARKACTMASGSAVCACMIDPVCATAGSACASTSSVANCVADDGGDGCVYQASQTPCTGTTPVCLMGGCVPCSPGTTQCSGTAAVQTCDSTGHFGTPWSCATGACASGACTGQTTAATSCGSADAGLAGCGASAESCCSSEEVPGGTYHRTYYNGPTAEADPATVSGFRLDKYLVTVGRFRRFVTAWNNGSGFTPAAGSGKHAYLNGGQGLTNSGAGGGFEAGWSAADDANVAPTAGNLACGGTPSFATWTGTPAGQENKPVNCVNWYEAYAFCIWDGGFLPSEAEWEYAAAGGSQERQYPWGTANPGTASMYAIFGDYTPNGPSVYNCYYPNGTPLTPCAGPSNIAPVGTAASGAGRWGQLDLVGELFEWNLDWYGPSGTYTVPCIDCAYLAAATYRVNRGCAFANDAVYLDPRGRNEDTPDLRSDWSGFRCARAP